LVDGGPADAPALPTFSPRLAAPPVSAPAQATNRGGRSREV